MEVLSKAKEQGKIKQIGLCNTYLEDLQKAQEIHRIEAVQGDFNIFSSWARDNLFSYLDSNNISFMSYGTFDKGIITGRVTKNRKYDESDARSWAPWWKQANRDDKYQKMEKIFQILNTETPPVTGVELAINYNLSFAPVDVALCGGRTFQQWDQIIAARQNQLPNDLILKVREICEN
jgi:aryl-alcohol dehydrogenase-like predicted oxidoreductase